MRRPPPHLQSASSVARGGRDGSQLDLFADHERSVDAIGDFAGAAEAQKPLIETAETKAHGLGAMSKVRWEELRETLTTLDFLKKPASLEGWSLY